VAFCKLALLSKIDGDSILDVFGGLFSGDVSRKIACGFLAYNIYDYIPAYNVVGGGGMGH